MNDMKALPSGLPSHVEVLSPVETVGFPEDWYLLNAKKHFWFDCRIRALRKQMDSIGLSSSHELHCLDIGCGTGILREQIEEFSNWIVDGAEMNISALAHSSPSKGRTLLYDIFDQRTDMKEAYDLIFLFDVIEHIQFTEPFLKATLHHLKPGGALIINVPSLQCLFSRYDEAVGHYRRYDQRQLKSELAGLPMDLLDIRYWGACLVPLLLLRRALFQIRNVDLQSIVNTGFKPPHAMFNSLFRSVMKLETSLISHPPFGTSLLMAARKQ